MIVVDTSIWIEHLREADPDLTALLNDNKVRMHPFVLAEVALGNLGNRQRVLKAMSELPSMVVATDDEMLKLIETNKFFGIGIGYVDAHLLTAARLTPPTLVWTRDKRLFAAADRLSLASHRLH